MSRPVGRFCGLSAVLAVLFGTTMPSADSREWPRLVIANGLTQGAMQIALAGATTWLSNESCRGVFAEFRDDAGNPLSDRLVPLGVDEAGYLRLIIFRDGSTSNQCNAPLTVMFTAPGHRVVFVCERQVEAMRRLDPGLLRAMVIHEALHTLGLGENPPTSSYITHRVMSRCRR